MKNFIKVLFAALTTLLAASCETTTGPETDLNLNQDLKFVLNVTEVDGTDVRISVTNNGTTEDTWYGFATTDLTTDILTAIDSELTRVLTDEGTIPVKKNTRLVVKPANLESNTKYRYIVFGVTPDAIVYGTPNSVEFETTKSDDKAEKTDDWKIQYAGRDYYEEAGEEMEYFLITPKDGKRYYFTTFAKYYLDYFSIDEIVLNEGKYIESFIVSGEYNINDLTCNTEEALGAERHETGEYVALAIGFDESGYATGYYSSLEFTIEEEEASEEYNKWLGVWEMTSAEGIEYTLTLEHYDNNFIYLVSGWEVGEGLAEPFEGIEMSSFKFPAYFGKYDNNSLRIKSYDISEVNFEVGPGYFGIFGYTTYEGTYQPICLAGDLIAKGMLSDNVATIDGVKTQIGIDATYTAMGYIGYTESNFVDFNPEASFPITMEKTAAAAGQMSSDASFKLPMKKPAYLSNSKPVATPIRK